MTPAEIERSLGATPGAVLLALAELAEELAPDSPSTAFASLWFELPWLLKPRAAPKGIFGSVKARFERTSREKTSAPPWFAGMGTPVNVLPFAVTGGNSNHFGFLMDGDGPLEERPVVMVLPRAGHEGTQVVAPNLREFLGLLAIAFGDVISRKASDADWFSFREDWYGEDDPERIVEMGHLSELLCQRIPGVRRPTRPSEVANRHPALSFELTQPFESAALPSVELDEGGRARVATIQAHQAFVANDHRRAVDLCRVGIHDPASRHRSRYLLSRSLTRLGEVAAAHEEIAALLGDWFHDAPVVPPSVHARRVVSGADLIALLRESAYPDVERLTAHIEATGDVGDVEGDVI